MPQPDDRLPTTNPYEGARDTSADEGVAGPPLTDELIADAERILGVRLPASYLWLMRHTNGGYFEDALGFPVDASLDYADEQFPVDALFGIGAADDHDPDDPLWCGDGILQTPYMVREWEIPEPVVLLNGDGHTWVALDYRTVGPQGEPPVVWLDVESGWDLPIAPTFAAFVDGLRRYEDE